MTGGEEEKRLKGRGPSATQPYYYIIGIMTSRTGPNHRTQDHAAAGLATPNFMTRARIPITS